MEENGRVHPGCVNAANPYHECGVYCLEKIADAKGRKDKDKKKLENHNGTKEVVLNTRNDDGGRLQLNCPKVANPYHECNEFCNQRTFNGANTEGVRKEPGSKFLDASRSFGKKKKGYDSQPKSTRALEASPPTGAVYTAGPKSPRSHFSRKKMEVENGESFSSSEQPTEEIYSRDQSFDKAHIQYSQSLPMAAKIMSPDDTPNKVKEAEMVRNSPKASLDSTSPKASSDANAEDGREDAKILNFSFLGIVQDLEESDEEEEVESVISDSCVSVGKYHVKASISSILQSIFDKYGDIAANCQLESASMRAYYLECLCAVVQELNSIPFKLLNKSKLKEMFAVLKDVESAHIDVRWLRALLNEISEALEFVSQHQTFESKKARCDRSLLSAKKELESQMEVLSQKEKEVADAREQVAETKARLDAIEHECSQLDKTISSIVSIMEKFQGKPLAADLF